MVTAYFLAGLTSTHFSIMNKIISAGKKPGLLVNDLQVGVSGSILSVSAHDFLLPCGVYATQDEVSSVDLGAYGLMRGATRSSWTLLWEIDTNLVSAPVLTLKSGIYTQDALTDYQCAVAWVMYAGNNTEIANATVVPALPTNKTLLKITRPAVDLVQKSVPSDVQVSEVVDGFKVSLTAVNLASTTKTLVLSAYGITEDEVPGELILKISTSDTGFTVAATIATQAAEQAVASGSNALAVGSSTLKLPLAYQRSIFDKWSPFSVNLSLRIPALGTVSLDQLVVTSTPRLSVG